MPCYHPLTAYLAPGKSKNGKQNIVFNPKKGYLDRPLKLPCGQCIGCRLERSRQWAVRCVHEASLHENNCFITLTYSPEHLPFDGSLQIDHFQKFMKRLRKQHGSKIRYFHCGEYGENLGRPHYHACLFNFDFEDKTLWKQTPQGDNLYRSQILEQLWPYGHSSIGDVTFESAAYVARYIMKKVNGDLAQEHYERVDITTGEIINLKPEYTTMSRRPGIGSDWLKKYQTDVYPHDFLVLRDQKMRPPRFYDNQYELNNAADLAAIKIIRTINGKKLLDNSTPERLAVRERVKLAQIKNLNRIVE